jgi:AraC family transcriptional regulator of adaptative response/methylated-DNA-[protein]-cysteine methyltransferase
VNRIRTNHAGTGMREENRWHAVLARDRRYDGAFVYAVRSTGVYCRPTCPSRRPRRSQVAFFALPEAAEQRGYRPCRRCRPREARAGDAQLAMVRELCRFMDAHADQPLTLAALAARAGINPLRLQRAFKRLLGITPRQYADSRRLTVLKNRLTGGKDVTTALYEAGYGSSSRLYERAPAHLGMTPATYRHGGEGMRIGYTITVSALGRMLVGATERGVCAVYLGSSDAPLEAALAREYPRADIHRDRNGFRGWVDSMLEHLRGAQPNLDLPTDVQATAFQRRVWEELRRIPYGATRTYRQIARAIGRPKAVRAVARACATNPTSVVVPCHRVVRTDGGLGGYRWGLERKQALLAQEKQFAARTAPRATART